MRYNYTPSISDNSNLLISDSGFMEALFGGKVNFSDFAIFQNKRAFFYEVSQIYNPCSEEYKYIVLYEIKFSK